MTIRERMEHMEHEMLSPYAALSENSKGRDYPEAPCDIRPVYQRDRDRILHCKAFRRLKNKTQVFLTPKGDHYRTRMSHTLEVSQNARTIAKALRLNEDLVEAIALGHDLGHTPFGHAGERVLNELCSGGFKHNKQSVRIVEKLEKGGQGLFVSVMAVDLTATVRTIARINRSLGQIDELAGRIKALSNDLGENLADRVLDAAEKGADWKESLADRREDLMEDLASWKEELAEQRSEYQLDLALRRAQRLEELEQLRKSLSELLDRHTFGQRRLLRAFPQMRSIDHKQALERLRQRQKERQEKKGGSV